MVGLCIVYNNWNYGSILQSYATLLKLEELGVEYEIISYEPVKDFTFYIKALPRLLNRDMVYSKRRALKKKIGLRRDSQFSENNSLREKCFKEFVNRYFTKFTPSIKTYDELCSYSEKFDAVIVGSDQLWLPSSLATGFYTLKFAPTNVKKIAYAASFGVTEIPFYQRKKTSSYLNNMDYISVREFTGHDIIKRLTSKESLVIVDPTLAISAEMWNKNLIPHRLVTDDYIFCYFLGTNTEHREAAKELAHETGLKIVTLRHLDEYVKNDEKFGDIAPYNVGPEEFINLIRYANYVCTDSFHGTVFSIMYHKQFLTFERYAKNDKNSRNSRVESLFTQLGIQRWYSGNVLKEINRNIDYSFVEIQLNQARKETTDFLSLALDI